MAMGFLDAIADLEPKKATGSAVGFLDFVDEEEVQKLEQERAQEAEWMIRAMERLHESSALLENLVQCMQPSKDNWDIYAGALITWFQSHDSVDGLIRFWVDREIRNTPKQATLFREDSIRIQGVSRYLLSQLVVESQWVQNMLYRPILRRIVNGSINLQRPGLVETVAFNIVRAMNEHIQDLPANVIQVLNMLSTSISSKWKAVMGENPACNFFFLHVITPLIVNPHQSKVVAEEITDRAVLLTLARVGKTVQKWVNSYDEESESLLSVTRSISIDALSEIDSTRSTNSEDSTSSMQDSSRGPRQRSAGEMEVMRFANTIFKTDGVLQEKVQPEAYEVADAKAALTAVMKKNYKLLVELEQGLDRTQVLAKHVGARQAKLFSAFSVGTSSSDLVPRTTKLFDPPEGLVSESIQAEQLVGSTFSDFDHSVVDSSVSYSMNGERQIFINTAAWSNFPHLKFAETSQALYENLMYSLMHTQGKTNCIDHMQRNSSAWTVAVLSLFPFLALSGRGRASVGVNSVIKRPAKAFLLTLRMDNSGDVLGESKKSSSSSGECRCCNMAGFIAGWCSAAVGSTMHCAEVKCIGRGDEVCYFVVSKAETLEATSLKVCHEIKSKHPKTWHGSLNRRKEDSKVTKRGSLMKKTPKLEAAHSLEDLLGTVTLSLSKDARTASRQGFSKKASSALTHSSKKLPKASLESSGDKNAVQSEALLERFRDLAPVSKSEAGEIYFGDQRYTLLRGQDFGANIGAMFQKVAQLSGIGSGKGRKALSSVRSIQKVSFGVLYALGLSSGESLGRAYGDLLTAKNVETQLELLEASFKTAGWGVFSFSRLSLEASDECRLVCHVRESFESEDRLGSKYDTGSPTCTMCAGMIAGFCSIIFGQRCVCVECECVGAGTSRDGSKCSFVCSFPATIAPQVKFYLAAAGHEELYFDLCGGLGVDVFETGVDANDPRGGLMSPSTPLSGGRKKGLKHSDGDY